MRIKEIKNNLNLLFNVGIHLYASTDNIHRLAHFIASLGISEEDFRLLLIQVPVLSNVLLRDPLLTEASWFEALKDSIASYVTAHFAVAPDPLLIVRNSSWRQRRMDSLARLLAVPGRLTQCIVIVIHAGQFYVAYNNPSSHEVEIELQQLIRKKMARLRSFLAEFIQITPERQILPQTSHVAETQMKEKIRCCVKRFICEDEVSSSLLPMPEGRAVGRKSLSQHLQNALLKILSSCLPMQSVDDKRHVWPEETIVALMQSDLLFVNQPIQFSPDASLHAEQVMRHYLLPLKETLKPGEKIVFGMPKLCCCACDNALRRSDWISYRGTHGVYFPNVMDLESESIYVSQNTKWTNYLCDQDSDSEVDVPTLIYGCNRFFPASCSPASSEGVSSESCNHSFVHSN